MLRAQGHKNLSRKLIIIKNSFIKKNPRSWCRHNVVAQLEVAVFFHPSVVSGKTSCPKMCIFIYMRKHHNYSDVYLNFHKIHYMLALYRPEAPLTRWISLMSDRKNVTKNVIHSRLFPSFSSRCGIRINPIKRKHRQYNIVLPIFAFFRALNFNRAPENSRRRNLSTHHHFYVRLGSILFSLS